ncbi:hypothetical protein Taro_011787 [Colocasia esculenta]|uniref:Uncharacterized protein n=1 Tax=Colocasia esculenta TaxID=4460 RepID=A0A843UBP2_COLES|nr:hypothetical protein [Colocasia esculenta]
MRTNQFNEEQSSEEEQQGPNLRVHWCRRTTKIDDNQFWDADGCPFFVWVDDAYHNTLDLKHQLMSMESLFAKKLSLLERKVDILEAKIDMSLARNARGHSEYGLEDNGHYGVVTLYAIFDRLND